MAKLLFSILFDPTVLPSRNVRIYLVSLSRFSRSLIYKSINQSTTGLIAGIAPPANYQSINQVYRRSGHNHVITYEINQSLSHQSLSAFVRRMLRKSDSTGQIRPQSTFMRLSGLTIWHLVTLYNRVYSSEHRPSFRVGYNPVYGDVTTGLIAGTAPPAFYNLI